MARLCQVCATQESKYKCPTCRVPYCSMACYKIHKETPCAAVAGDDPSRSATEPSSAAPQRRASHAQEQEDADEGVPESQLLSANQLKRLKESRFVSQHLVNPAVQELAKQVDGAGDRMKALEKALLDPTFSNFMYKALDEIESVPR